MARYVVGFMFTTDLSKVLLILKNKPEWQSGKLNGIGGKVEDGETFHAALAREFLEETGARFDGWKFYTKLTVPPDKGWDDIYFAVACSGAIDSVSSPTSEKVFLIDVATVEHSRIAEGWPMPDDGGGRRAVAPVLYNLPWLIRMGIDSLMHEVRYDVIEQR